MTISNRIVIAAAAILMVLVGCAGFGKRWEPPNVSLVNIEVQKAGLFETVFKIDLRVYNTNAAALTIKGIECHLKLQGKDFATGVSNETIAIPAFETGVISLAVYSSVLEIVKGLMTLPREEKLVYALSGRVHLEGGAIVPSFLTFESEGRLNLKDFFAPR